MTSTSSTKRRRERDEEEDNIGSMKLSLDDDDDDDDDSDDNNDSSDSDDDDDDDDLLLMSSAALSTPKPTSTRRRGTTTTTTTTGGGGKRSSSRIAQNQAALEFQQSESYLIAKQIHQAEQERSAKRHKMMSNLQKSTSKLLKKETKIDEIHQADEHKHEDIEGEEDFAEGGGGNSKRGRGNSAASGSGSDSDAATAKRSSPFDANLLVDREAINAMTCMNVNISTKYLSSRTTLLLKNTRRDPNNKTTTAAPAPTAPSTSTPSPSPPLLLYTSIHQVMEDLQEILEEELEFLTENQQHHPQQQHQQQLQQQRVQFLELVQSESFTPSSLVEFLQRLVLSSSSSRPTTNTPMPSSYYSKSDNNADHDPTSSLRSPPPPPSLYPRRLIQWLFVLASSPSKTTLTSTSKTTTTDTTTNKGSDTLLLAQAQRAAYQLLIQHWSSSFGSDSNSTNGWYYYSHPAQSQASSSEKHDGGRTPQKEQQQQQQMKSSTYFITLKAMTDQLRQWYGLTLPPPSEPSESSSSDDRSSKSSDVDDRSPQRSNDVLIDPCPSTSTTRFLHLWSVALRTNHVKMSQMQVLAGGTQKEATRNHHHVFDTLCAILWTLLDPSVGYGASTKTFSSSASSSSDSHDDYDNDPVVHIRNIVESIVCHWYYHSQSSDIVDSIISISTQRLGPGRSGTDACDDVNAWLCLSAMLRCLSSSPPPKSIIEYNTEYDGFAGFRLSFAQSILCEAFPITVPASSHQQQNNSSSWCQTIVNEDDRLQKCFDDLPVESNPSLRALFLCVASLNRLSVLFPTEDAPKYMAVAEIAAICFLLGMKSLYSEMTSLARTIETNEENDFDVDRFDDETRSGRVKLKRFYEMFEIIEGYCQSVSSQARNLVMQSVCFPRGTHEIETIRGYILRSKDNFAAYSAVPTPKNQKQEKIDSFFKTPGK